MRVLNACELHVVPYACMVHACAVLNCAVLVRCLRVCVLILKLHFSVICLVRCMLVNDCCMRLLFELQSILGFV